MNISASHLRKMVRLKIIQEASQKYLGGKDMSTKPEAVYTKDIEFDGYKYGENKTHSSEPYFILSGRDELGSIQDRGDPYTYEPEGEDALRVISAPESGRSKINTIVQRGSSDSTDGDSPASKATDKENTSALNQVRQSMSVCGQQINTTRAIGNSLKSPLEAYAKRAKNVMKSAASDFNVGNKPISVHLGWPEEWGKGFNTYSYKIPRAKNIGAIKSSLGSKNSNYVDEMIALATELDSGHDKWIISFTEAHQCAINATHQTMIIMAELVGASKWKDLFQSIDDGELDPAPFIKAIAPVWKQLANTCVMYPPIQLAGQNGLNELGAAFLFWVWEKGIGTTGTRSINGHLPTGAIDALEMGKTWPDDPGKLIRKLRQFWLAEDDPSAGTGEGNVPIGTWKGSGTSPQSFLI